MRVAVAVLGALTLASCGAAAVKDAQPVVDTLSNTAAVSADPVTSEATIAESTVADVFAQLTPADIEELGGAACATEVAHIVVAGERYVARTGTYASTIDELRSDLDVQPVLWTIDSDSQQLLPAPGSPCPDFAAERTRRGKTTFCTVNQRTLDTAVQAFIAQHGVAPEGQQQLVDDGFIIQVVDDFQVLDGSVLVIAGSACERLLEDERVRLDAEDES